MYALFSHNDLDGIGCGIVAKCAFGGDVEVRYHSVDGLNEQIRRFLGASAGNGGSGVRLFITDLSVDEENEIALDRYAGNGGSVRLIDHHKTALHFNRYPWASVRVEYEDGRLASATSLFYEELVRSGHIRPSDALGEFVELVRQYDTWEWVRTDNIRAKRLNDLFYLLSPDEFEEKMLDRLKRGGRFEFDEFEEKLLDLEEEKIGRYVRRKKRELVQTFIGDRCVGIVHAESYHSELGNELGRDNPHLDYIAILNMGGRRASFRTIHDGIDVSEIAGRYGGGGHAKAAGCSMTGDMYDLYVAEPFRIEPVRPDAPNNRYNEKSSPYGTLYENRKGDRLFLYKADEGWVVDRNGEAEDGAFSTFEEAERHTKRRYAAWLAHDELYVRYLKDSRSNGQ